jgi:hypothetical protein
MAEASQLKLRLLRGSPRRYEPAKSELSGFNRKKFNFRTFDPHSKPRGGGWADRTSTGRWSSTKGHCGKVWRRNLERLILAGRRATRPRREVKTRRKEAAKRAYKKPILH